jgi:hypothetical protein
VNAGVLEWQQLVSRSAIYPPKSPNKSTISGVASGRASERICSLLDTCVQQKAYFVVTARPSSGVALDTRVDASTRARRVNIHLRSKDNSSPSWRKCPESIFRSRIILSNLDQKISIQNSGLEIIYVFQHLMQKRLATNQYD